jgi:septum formation protein
VFQSFTVIDPNLDESSDLLPLEARAEHLASEKARAVQVRDALVIASDTIVGIGAKEFGKPADLDQARQLLVGLSGREHRVMTAICLLWPGGKKVFHEVATVRFKSLSPDQIDSYLATGEPLDKAGGYAIQGEGAGLIESFEGDRDIVIGLPVRRLRLEFERLKLIE